MTVKRYPLQGGRELRTARASTGLLVVAIHHAGRCVTGPLAIREADLDTLRSALADLAGETGPEAATDVERPATGTPCSGEGTR